MDEIVEILPINTGTDGDGRKWPKHHYERNDDYCAYIVPYNANVRYANATS